MSQVRRLLAAAEHFFVERAWWQALPAALALITLAIYRGPFRIGGHPATYAVTGLVLIGSALLMLLPSRRSMMGLPTLIVLAIVGGLLSAVIPQSWTIVLPYLAAFIATRRYEFRIAVIVIITAGFAVTFSQLGAHHSLPGAIASVAILVALSMSAVVRKARGERLEQIELALAREQAARQEHERAAALAERARIAREVHDVLAHSLSALSLNLQGAQLMLANEDASEQVQEQIRRAQRLVVEGLAETRRAVAALREDPVPAARAIADLVTSARLETGTEAEFTVEGTPRELPAPAEDALFRTAQEALSNARKHAAGAPVCVKLSYGDDATELTVTDHQGHRPADVTDGGYGLTGMRERAELIGGELDTGPTDDGWRVRLVVPA